MKKGPPGRPRRVLEVSDRGPQEPKFLDTALKEKQGSVRLDSECDGKLECETAPEDTEEEVGFSW